MDLSSLPEAERKQLEKLQQQFQEHQQAQAAQLTQQQQQQQQDYASQHSYNQSQAQSFDHSYYSYYQQRPQYTDPQHPQHSQQEQHQQHYPYYQIDYQSTHYSNAYQQHTQFSESAHIHPPGVSSAPPSAGGEGQGQGQHQQNAYYPLPSGEEGRWVPPPGMNPAAAAAVAALSQLTQFAGSMDAAERAMVYGKGGGIGQMIGVRPLLGQGLMQYGMGQMQPPAVQHQSRGRGRRGGGLLRGGRLESFGNRTHRTGRSQPHIRRRGRGRGRGGPRSLPSDVEPSTSHRESSAAEAAEEDAGISADHCQEELITELPAHTSSSAQENASPKQQPAQAAWCELCRVECTSLEILEQHKNGKRHKKNLQRLEKFKGTNVPAIESQNPEKPPSHKAQIREIPIARSNSEVTLQPEKIHEGEENMEIQPENLVTETAMEEINAETQKQTSQGGQLENNGDVQSNKQPRKPWMNHSENHRLGIKRKMKGGRGGKRFKTFGAPKWSTESKKPKVVIPLICDLCNVKCDTKEVFDRHLSGKKHISKVKRFEGHQAMYGPLGLQALYPPNPIAQTLLRPQGPQQGFYGPQNSYHTSQGEHVVTSTMGAGLEFQQNLNPPMSATIPPADGGKAIGETQQHMTTCQPENKQVSNAVVDEDAGNGNLKSKGTGLNPPLDSKTAGTSIQ